MKKLTDKQILAILRLSENVPEIKSSDVSNGAFGVWVDIRTQIDADKQVCDRVITKIFPYATYVGEPNVHGDEVYVTESYRLYDPSGIHLTLHMKKTPAPTEVPPEIIHPNYTTESEVVANA